MKTNWTIFFDKGVMKAYQMPELLPEHPDRHYMAGSYGTTMYKEQVQEEQEEIDNENEKRVEAARLSALPVAEESKDKIKWLIWDDDNLNPPPCPDFEIFKLDQTKEYQIEAEFREEVYCKDDGFDGYSVRCKSCECEKVLVLSSNH